MGIFKITKEIGTPMPVPFPNLLREERGRWYSGNEHRLLPPSLSLCDLGELPFTLQKTLQDTYYVSDTPLETGVK